MSNALGHVLSVTNRGLHSSASVNAQQNRITPDWADTATSELPSEAFYLYDLEGGQWFSPTYLPLRDKQAAYSVEFGVDGTATFRMERPEIATELTTFVPPQEPTGVYLLTVANRGRSRLRLRLAPYFEIVLADNPENAGPLKVDYERTGVLRMSASATAQQPQPVLPRLATVLVGSRSSTSVARGNFGAAPCGGRHEPGSFWTEYARWLFSKNREQDH